MDGGCGREVGSWACPGECFSPIFQFKLPSYHFARLVLGNCVSTRVSTVRQGAKQQASISSLRRLSLAARKSVIFTRGEQGNSVK